MSFDAYESYKASGVEWLGPVPSHWLAQPLKTVASWNDEVLPDATSLEKEIEYLEISGVNGVEGIADTTVMSFADAPSRARRRVRAGDVLISTVRTYLRAIAPVTETSSHLIVSTGFAVLRPTNADGRYLGYAVRSEPFIAEVISRSVGVSYPAINASDLVRIIIGLPPKDEQRRIADFLDRETAKIDAMVEEQRRLIALLKEKCQAVISHAVTRGLDANVPLKSSGADWLGDVPAHWEVKPIRYLCRSFDQGWSPQCESYPVDHPSQWGVLKVGCVNGGAFDPSENKILPDELDPQPDLSIKLGDLLISRANTRELVGSAACVEADNDHLMISDKLYRIRFTDGIWMARFVSLVLGTRGARAEIELEATGASSSMLNIAQDTILSMPVPCPPPSEIEAISSTLGTVLADLAQRSADAEQVVALLQERRAALISAAVTGEIHVCGWTAEEVRNAVSAEIIHLHARDRTFGRVEYQKLHFLAQAYAGVDEVRGRFLRWAAGPHDPDLMPMVERSLLTNGVVGSICQDDGGNAQVTYAVVKGTRPARKRLKAMLGDRLPRLDHLLTTLNGQGKSGVEAVATLFAVWNDALLDGETPDDDRLVRGFLKEWHPEKAEKFKEADVRHWIGFMRRNALVPEGRSPHTGLGSLL